MYRSGMKIVAGRISNRLVCTVLILSPALALAEEATPEQGQVPVEGQIVFSSDRSGPWRIWIVRANGEGMRQITEGGPDEHDVDPCFSPDGETILFSSTRGGNTGVWTVPISGGALKRICDGDQAEWSPDGTKIALRRNNSIIVRDLNINEERTLTPKDWPLCSGPAWSPDGKTIAFAARWDAGNGVYLAPFEGGEPTKVYDEKGACEPHFTPDGELIVYETETHICTIKPNGEKNRMVTYQAGVQRYGRAGPDGKRIVYCQGMSENGPWELYLVPVRGGVPQKLTQGGSDMNPDWK